MRLGRVCKTLVWARCRYGTRRFDRRAMETFGAAPTTQQAEKEALRIPISSPHPKRHPVDRDRTAAPWRDLPQRYAPWRRTVASCFYRWPKAGGVWERVLKALQRQKDAQGESSGLGDPLLPPGRDHREGSSALSRGKRGDPQTEALGYSQGRRFFDQGAHKRAEGSAKPMVFFVLSALLTAQRDGRLSSPLWSGERSSGRAAEDVRGCLPTVCVRRERLRQGGYSTLPPQALGHQDHHSAHNQRAPRRRSLRSGDLSHWQPHRAADRPPQAVSAGGNEI